MSQLLRFNVDAELIHRALHLPGTAAIESVRSETDRSGTLVLVFDVRECNVEQTRALAIDVEPTCTRDAVTWNWNLPEAASS